MACMAVPAIDVREAVLSALREAEFRPLDLLNQLGQQGYTDSEIQRALSTLLHEGEIELTSQRILKVRSRSAA
jgi:hypothetical protein